MEGQRRRQRRRTATGEGRREHTGASRHLYEQKGEERAAKVKRREASHAAYAQTFLSFSSTPRRARFLRRLLANSRITLTPNPSRIALIPRPFRECLAENDLNVGRDSTSRREQPFRRVGGEDRAASRYAVFHSVNNFIPLCPISATQDFFLQGRFSRWRDDVSEAG